MGAAGLKVAIVRSPIQAKGILLGAIRDPNPTIVFEPKVLYRAAGEYIHVLDAIALTCSVEEVPVDDYTLPLDQVDTIRKGTDLTVVSYGTPLYTTRKSPFLGSELLVERF